MSNIDPDLHSLVVDEEKSPNLVAKLSEEIDLRRPSISEQLTKAATRYWPLEYSIEDYIEICPIETVIVENRTPSAHIHATIIRPSNTYLAEKAKAQNSELAKEMQLEAHKRLKSYSENLFVRLFFFEDSPNKNKRLAKAISEFISKDRLREQEKKKILSSLIKLIDSPEDSEAGSVSSRIQLARQLIYSLAFPQAISPDKKGTKQHVIQQLLNLNPVRAVADICSQLGAGKNNAAA